MFSKIKLKKGFVNIAVIVLIVILASGTGYFALTKELFAPIERMQSTSTPLQQTSPQLSNETDAAKTSREAVNETPNPSDKPAQSSFGDCVIRPRTPIPDKSKAADITNLDAVYPDLIDLKFQEGSGVRLRNGSFISFCGVDLTQLNSVILADSSIRPQRLFTRSEEDLAREYERAVANNPTVADLNLWYRIRIQGNTDYQKLQNLIRRLNSFSIVEIATTAPKPAPPPGL